MQKNVPILDYETCVSIGCDAEDAIIECVKEKLNSRHPVQNGLSYYDSLALDIFNDTDGLITNCDTPAKKEIIDIIREEYRKLDELNSHCLFLYLGCWDKEENEMVNDIAWHLEEVMMDRAEVLLAPAQTQRKLRN